MRHMGDTISASLDVPGLNTVTNALGLTQPAPTTVIVAPQPTTLLGLSTSTWCWIAAGALALYLLRSK